MKRYYPTLDMAIYKRGIKKLAIARQLKISERTLRNKMQGITSFTWGEVCSIQECFFPDITKDELFSRND
jgi:DNA-binding Xre family transcriptional regulator